MNNITRVDSNRISFSLEGGDRNGKDDLSFFRGNRESKAERWQSTTNRAFDPFLIPLKPSSLHRLRKYERASMR